MSHSRPMLSVCLAISLVVSWGCSDDGGGGGDGGSSCSPACGPNATCESGSCACVAGWLDCDDDLGKSGGNGCECSDTCNGSMCSTGPMTCKPSVVNDCGNKTMYCQSDNTCGACPGGKYNCDGIQDCESDTDCTPDGTCDIYGTKTCGSQSQYCDDATKTCKPCPTGTYNCSQSGGDCECTSGCDGQFCKKECTIDVGCGDSSKYCDMGQCMPCPAGQANCDGKGTCECTGTCDGTACTGTKACDYTDTNACGGDTSQWCYENQCKPCTSGFYNCNNTKGCECDSAGCNGTACAGKCMGGECP